MLIDNMPSSVCAAYCGPLRHDQLAQVVEQYHLLFLPTFGENFGHTILDFLRYGCLVLTSNLTPWRNLTQAQVGWDLPLEDEAQFKAAIPKRWP